MYYQLQESYAVGNSLAGGKRDSGFWVSIRNLGGFLSNALKEEKKNGTCLSQLTAGIKHGNKCSCADKLVSPSNVRLKSSTFYINRRRFWPIPQTKQYEFCWLPCGGCLFEFQKLKATPKHRYCCQHRRGLTS